LPKTFTEMTEAERVENRRRIAFGLPADFEADSYGVQTPESLARDHRRPAAVIIEVSPVAIVQHIAVADSLETAVRLAKERGLRWACGGSPAAVAGMMPPIDASAAICSTIEHASILATAPKWHHCRPQLTRTGHRA
jgi:hypothetical protein